MVIPLKIADQGEKQQGGQTRMVYNTKPGYQDNPYGNEEEV
jgi:hypothetical protein